MKAGRFVYSKGHKRLTPSSLGAALVWLAVAGCAGNFAGVNPLAGGIQSGTTSGSGAPAGALRPEAANGVDTGGLPGGSTGDSRARGGGAVTEVRDFRLQGTATYNDVPFANANLQVFDLATGELIPLAKVDAQGNPLPLVSGETHTTGPKGVFNYVIPRLNSNQVLKVVAADSTRSLVGLIDAQGRAVDAPDGATATYRLAQVLRVTLSVRLTQATTAASQALAGAIKLQFQLPESEQPEAIGELMQGLQTAIVEAEKKLNENPKLADVLTAALDRNGNLKSVATFEKTLENAGLADFLSGEVEKAVASFSQRAAKRRNDGAGNSEEAGNRPLLLPVTKEDFPLSRVRVEVSGQISVDNGRGGVARAVANQGVTASPIRGNLGGGSGGGGNNGNNNGNNSNNSNSNNNSSPGGASPTIVVSDFGEAGRTLDDLQTVEVTIATGADPAVDARTFFNTPPAASSTQVINQPFTGGLGSFDAPDPLDPGINYYVRLQGFHGGLNITAGVAAYYRLRKEDWETALRLSLVLGSSNRTLQALGDVRVLPTTDRSSLRRIDALVLEATPSVEIDDDSGAITYPSKLWTRLLYSQTPPASMTLQLPGLKSDYPYRLLLRGYDSQGSSTPVSQDEYSLMDFVASGNLDQLEFPLYVGSDSAGPDDDRMAAASDGRFFATGWVGQINPSNFERIQFNNRGGNAEIILYKMERAGSGPSGFPSALSASPTIRLDAPVSAYTTGAKVNATPATTGFVTFTQFSPAADPSATWTVKLELAGPLKKRVVGVEVSREDGSGTKTASYGRTGQPKIKTVMVHVRK